MDDIILAWGGGNEACHSQETIDYMKGLKFSCFHYVSKDLNPRKDICDRLLANGIFPVYDVEGALWAGTYSPASIEWAIPALQAIMDAGWKGFSSEGMFGPNVDIIRKIGPYVNYGGENGEQMLGGYYGHWAGQHTANYMECYHKYALDAYKATAKTNLTDTPKEMGLTWMMYPQTADLEMDTNAMLEFMRWGESQGINWKVALFWMGINQCPSDVIRDGTFMPLLNMVTGNYNVVRRTAWNQSDEVISPPENMLVNGELYSFAQGTDNRLWGKAFSNGAWTEWISLGGTLTSSPAWTFDGEGVLYVFVRGTDNGLWYKKLAGTEWSGWMSLGGILKGAPEAMTMANGSVHVFCKGADDSYWHRSVTGGWEWLGGKVA